MRADGEPVRRVSVPAEALCRRRLPGAGVSGCGEEGPGSGECGDRQALGPGYGLLRSAQALDRREDIRLAQSLPKAGQGLGVSQPKGARLPPPRLHPPHAAKAMQSSMMFPDRLLEAAHISPYRGLQSNHPQNGLLLRADLHSLFDLGMLAVDPLT